MIITKLQGKQALSFVNKILKTLNITPLCDNNITKDNFIDDLLNHLEKQRADIGLVGDAIIMEAIGETIDKNEIKKHIENYFKQYIVLSNDFLLCNTSIAEADKSVLSNLFKEMTSNRDFEIVIDIT